MTALSNSKYNEADFYGPVPTTPERIRSSVDEAASNLKESNLDTYLRNQKVVDSVDDQLELQGYLQAKVERGEASSEEHAQLLSMRATNINRNFLMDEESMRQDFNTFNEANQPQEPEPYQNNSPFYRSLFSLSADQKRQVLERRAEDIQRNFGEGSQIDVAGKSVRELMGMGLSQEQALTMKLQHGIESNRLRAEELRSDEYFNMNPNRSIFQALGDVSLDVGVGATRLVQGAYELVNLLSIPFMQEGLSLDDLTQFSAGFAEATEWLKSNQSEAQRRANMSFEREMALRLGGTTTERALRRAKASGRDDADWHDIAMEMLREFGTGIDLVRNNPMVLRSMLVENAIDLIGPGLVKKGLDGLNLVKSARILRDAANSNRRMSPEEIARIQRLQRREDIIIGTATITAQEGGLNAAEVRQQVLGMTHEELMNHEYYSGLIGYGFDEDTARRIVANNAFMTTYGIAGLIASVSSVATGAGRFEASLFDVQTRFGRSIFSIPAAGAVGFGIEGTQEIMQSGGGRFAQNVGLNLFADDRVRLADGVAADAGIGFVIGGALGSGAGTLGALTRVGKVNLEQNILPQAKVIADANKALAEDAGEVEPDTNNKDSFAAYSDPSSPFYDPIRTLGTIASSTYLKKSRLREDAEVAKRVFTKMLEASGNAMDALNAQLNKETVTPQEVKAIQGYQAFVAQKLNIAATMLAQLEDSQSELYTDWNNSMAAVTELLSEERNLTQQEIDEVFQILGSDPEAIPDSVLLEAINSPNEETSQRGHMLMAAKEALTELNDQLNKTPEQVRRDIVEGGVGFLGIQNYKKLIKAAVALGNPKLVEKHLKSVEAFAGRQARKAEVARFLKIEGLKPEAERHPDYQMMFDEYRETYSPKDKQGNIKGNGSTITGATPDYLIKAIETEARALERFVIAQKDFIGRAKVNVPVAQETAPQPVQEAPVTETKETKAPVKKKAVKKVEKKKEQQAEAVAEPVVETPAKTLPESLLERLQALPPSVISENGIKALERLIERNDDKSLSRAEAEISKRETEAREEALAIETQLSESTSDPVVEDKPTKIKKIKKTKSVKEQAKEVQKQIQETIEGAFEPDVPELSPAYKRFFKEIGLSKEELVDRLMRSFPNKDAINQPERSLKRAAEVAQSIRDFIERTVDKDKVKSNKYYRDTQEYLANAYPNKVVLSFRNLRRDLRFILKRRKINKETGETSSAVMSRKYSIRDLFALSEKDNPLHKEGDLERMLTTSEGVEQFIKKYSVTEETASFLRNSFQPYMASFVSTIDSMYKHKSSIQDVMKGAINALVDKETQTLNRQAVLAMGISAYSKMANEMRMDMERDNKNLEAYLGSKAVITKQAVQLLRYAGSNKSALAESIGTDVLQMLGLSLKKKLPEDVSGLFNENLKAAIGQVAIDVLSTESVGLLEQRHINDTLITPLEEGKDIPEGTYFFNEATGEIENYIGFPEIDAKSKKKKKIVTKGDWFVRFRGLGLENKNGIPVANPTPDLDNLFNAYDIQDVEDASTFDDLFSTQRERALPTYKPQPFKQKTMARTIMRIPAKVKKILSGYQQQAFTVNEGFLKVFENLSEDVLLNIGDSLMSAENTPLYVRNRSGDAKESNMRKGIQDSKKWLEKLNKDGKDKFYLNWEMWKNMRMGIKTLINPQNNKLQRHLFGMASHKTEYKSDDTVGRTMLTIAFMQSLGMKIDTGDMEALFKDFANLIAPLSESEIEALPERIQRQRDAIQIALQNLKAMDMQSLDEEGKVQLEQSVLAAILGVKGENGYSGMGEGYMSLHGLVEMARVMNYSEHDINGEFTSGFVYKNESFSSDMVLEVDGKTNGFAFMALQMPNSPEKTVELLEKVGIFSNESYRTLNEYFAKVQNAADIYKTLGNEWFNQLTSLITKAKDDAMAEQKIIEEIDPSNTRNLSNFVLADYRKIRATLHLFGDMTANMRSMAKKPVMTTMYGSSIESAVRAFMMESLEGLYYKIAAGDVNIEALNELGIKLDAAQEKIFVSDPVNFLFTPEQTNILLDNLGTLHGRALAEALASGFLAEYIDSQKRANKVVNLNFEVFQVLFQDALNKKKAEKNGLEPTKEELDGIFESLVEYAPVYMGYYATERMEGINPMKSTRYEFEGGEVANSYKEDNANRLNNSQSTMGANRRYKGFTSNIWANTTTHDAPGAGGVVTSIHGMDASTMLYLLERFQEVFNVHDAVMVNPTMAFEAARVLNEGFFEVSKNVELVKQIEEQAEKAIEKYKEITEYSKEAENRVNGWYKKLVKNSVSSMATNTRENVLGNITAVNQYATSFVAHLPFTGTTPSSISEVAVENAQELIEEARNIDENELGSTGETLNNFNPDVTTKATAEAITTLSEQLSDLDGPKLSPQHKGRLGRVAESLFGLLDKIDIELQNAAPKNLGLYHTKNKRIQIQVANPLLTANSQMGATETLHHELVHAALTEALKVNSMAQRRFKYLYRVVGETIPQDWFVDPNDSAADQERSRALYDYIFGSGTQRKVKSVDPITGIETTNYVTAGLDEFAAFALTNERMIEFINRPEIREKLIQGERRMMSQSNARSRFVRALNNAYAIIFNWFQDVIKYFVNSRLGLNQDQSTHDMILALSTKMQLAQQAQAQKLAKGASFNDRLNQRISDKASDVIGRGLIGLAPTKPGGVINTLRSTAASIGYNLRENAANNDSAKFGIAAFFDGIADIRRDMNLYSDGLFTTIAREMVGQNITNRMAYGLQRIATNNVDRVAVNTSRTVGSFLLDSFTKQLSKGERSALGTVLVYTDLAALLSDTANVANMSEAELSDYLKDPKNKAKQKQQFDYIRQLLKNPEYRRTEINRLEREISALMGNAHKKQAVHYLKMARSLGRDMATGVMEQHNQMRNAHAIAQLVGTSLEKTGKEDKAEVLIDKLASIVALEHTDPNDIAKVNSIIDSEMSMPNNTFDNNGIMKTLILAAQVQQQARETLFGGNKMQMIKGYTKQVIDDRVTIEVATAEEGLLLEKEGFKKVSENPLTSDKVDRGSKPRFLYVSTTGKLRTYEKQILSLTSLKKRGISVDALSDLTTGDGTVAQNNFDDILSAKARLTDSLSMSTQPQQDVLMRPLINEKGEIVDYVFTMNERTKHNFLDKQDMFDLVLGQTFGSVVSKPRSQQMNELAIDGLFAMYQEEYVSNPNAYVWVGENAIEDENREYWYMLPREAREHAEMKFGEKGMWVRDDLKRLFFGYRRKTISDLIQDVADKRASKLGKDEESTIVNALNHLAYMLDSKPVRTVEQFWQELVVMAKDAIVIKSGAVLVANIMSNNLVLGLDGVSLPEMVKYQKEGWDAITDFQRDLDEKNRIELEIKSNQSLTQAQIKKMQDRIAQINNNIARNPAIDLLQSGVYQSIVEDVNLEEDHFTFKNSIERKLEPVLEKVPDVIKDIGAAAFITHETRLYKMLRNTTQKSDFVARFAMHRKNMERGMTYEDSVNKIMDLFVDYNSPTHPTVQYLNDMGVIMFTKFFFRIQKVIAYQMARKPANVFSFFLLKGMTGVEVPSIYDVIATDPTNTANRMYTPFDNLEAVLKGNLLNFSLVDGLGYVK